MERRGPLTGIKVLELAGLGPVPHAGMVLADLGADVLRVDRPGARPAAPPGPVDRGRRSVALDLGRPEGVQAALRLADAADVLVEGFRPGVTERLGLGPDTCLARNPGLVYARMTGWGQDGPLARSAGHDLNYLALTGALAAVGPAGGDPVPPLNLVGDYGGGSMLLLVGVLAALVERGSSGCGQVVDAAMVDGVSSLLALTHGLLAAGLWREERGANLLDGGAPYYRTYRCADGGYVAVAALEERFWGELVRVLELDLTGVGDRNDPASWPLLESRLAHAFAARPRDAWAAAFERVDACVTPVLTFTESAGHPQVGGRGAVTASGGALAPGAAPRFSRTPGRAGDAARRVGADTRQALLDWGLTVDDVDDLLAGGAAVQARPPTRPPHAANPRSAPANVPARRFALRREVTHAPPPRESPRDPEQSVRGRQCLAHPRPLWCPVRSRSRCGRRPRPASRRRARSPPGASRRRPASRP